MTTAGVKTCRIPGAVLYHPELSLPEKMLLGLVWTFPDGLRLSNAEIGRILCKHPDTVSRLVKKLEAGGWVKITGNQSRWRRLYFDAEVKVKDDSTLTFSDSTLTPTSIYSDPHVKQNRKIKEEENFSFSDANNETPSETNPTPENPDPERERRVLESLGLAI